ncbi:hypothetical protein OSG_eHP40_00265 [environmental Halophage eHP-40]|nr:hypothetical protein OSG_eHP40_00265 [environmental Halophage eHP-40]
MGGKGMSEKLKPTTDVWSDSTRQVARKSLRGKHQKLANHPVDSPSACWGKSDRLLLLPILFIRLGLNTNIMPFAGYDDFDDCVSENSDKRDPEAYVQS